MTELESGVTVVVVSGLSWLGVAYHAWRDRQVWREYYTRQCAEIARREERGVHARRVRVAGGAGQPVALGFVTDDTKPLWIGPRTISSRAVELVDRDGATLTLPAGVSLLVHDLPGAEWREASAAGGANEADQEESAYDLVVKPEVEMVVLAEGRASAPADPYRGAPPPDAPLARIPHDLTLANPWIKLSPTCALASSARAFDLEISRRGGFRAWIVGLAILAGFTILTAVVGDGQPAFALGAMLVFATSFTGNWVLSLPIPRRAPPEPPKSWRAEER